MQVGVAGCLTIFTSLFSLFLMSDYKKEKNERDKKKDKDKNENKVGVGKDSARDNSPEPILIAGENIGFDE